MKNFNHLSILLAYLSLAGTTATAEEVRPLSQRITHWLSLAQQQDERPLRTLQSRLREQPPHSSGHRGENVGVHSLFQEDREQPLDLIIDLGDSHSVDRIVLFPVPGMFRGRTIEGYGFPERVLIELAQEEEFTEPVLRVDSRDVEPAPRPEYPMQVALAEPVDARYLRLRVLEHWTREDGRFLTALGEVMVISQGVNVALRATVKARSFTSLPDWHRDHLVDGQTDLGLPVRPEPSPSNGFLTKGQSTAATDKWIQLVLPQVARVDEVVMIPAQPVDAPDQFGHGFPRRFRLLISEESDFASAQVLADYRDVAFPNPGGNPVAFQTGGASARFVRLEVNEMWHVSTGKYNLSLAEIEVFEEGKNVALGSNVKASDVFSNPRFLDVWQPEYLVDGYSSQNRLIGLSTWLAGLEERKQTERQISQLQARIAKRADRTLGWVLGFSSVLVTGSLGWVVAMIVRRKRALARHQEALRARIARDLHDDIGSRLGGMRLLSESLLGATELPKELRGDLDLLHRSSSEATDAMRDMVWLLDTRERSLDKLRRQMKRLVPTIVGPLRWVFHIVDEPQAEVDFEFRREVLSAFREALSNAARHSKSDRIECRVGGDVELFWFEVRDWGKGFEEKPDSSGHGIANIRKRANTLGGEVAIESRIDEGTKVTFSAPHQRPNRNRLRDC